MPLILRAICMQPDPAPETVPETIPPLQETQLPAPEEERDPRLVPFYDLQQRRLDVQNILITHPLGFEAFHKWKAQEDAKCAAKPKRVRRPSMPVSTIQGLVAGFLAEAEALCPALDKNGEPAVSSELSAIECEVNHWKTQAEFAAWVLELRSLWDSFCELRAQIVTDNIPLAKSFFARRQNPQWLAEDLFGELLRSLHDSVDSFIPCGYAFSSYACSVMEKVRAGFFKENPIQAYLDNMDEPAEPSEEADESVCENDRQHFFKELVSRGLAQLDERTRLIITFRFGLDGEPPWTLEQIGELAGKTRERIRQIEAEALTVLLGYFVDEGRSVEIVRNISDDR